jgi:small subunit ribosomal protein S4
MGKPKFSRKKYETPSHPWQADRIKAENEITKKYGLKNKREIWKAQTSLRRYRGQARSLLAKIGTEDKQAKKESDQLLMHLTRYNVLPPNSTLDDVLALETETVLSRRLQTLTYLKGLANTPTQARQLIAHGHIQINGRKVTVPSYMVTKDEENEISYVGASPLNDLMHPARPRADFKSPIPSKKEVKPDETPKEEAKPETEVKEKPAKEKTESTTEPVEEKTKMPVEESPKDEGKPEKPAEETKEEAVEKPEETKAEPEGEQKEEKTEEPIKEKDKGGK